MPTGRETLRLTRRSHGERFVGVDDARSSLGRLVEEVAASDPGVEPWCRALVSSPALLAELGRLLAYYSNRSWPPAGRPATRLAHEPECNSCPPMGKLTMNKSGIRKRRVATPCAWVRWSTWQHWAALRPVAIPAWAGRRALTIVPMGWRSAPTPGPPWPRRCRRPPPTAAPPHFGPPPTFSRCNAAWETPPGLACSNRRQPPVVATAPPAHDLDLRVGWLLGEGKEGGRGPRGGEHEPSQGPAPPSRPGQLRGQ